MPIANLGLFLNSAKEQVLVAFGLKSMTAGREKEIRDQLAKDIIKAGGTNSDVVVAQKEVTEVIEYWNDQQVTIPGAIETVLANNPLILIAILGIMAIILIPMFKR